MKKTLLTAALLTTITALHAQREVGTAQRISFEMPAARGTDTLFLSSFADGLEVLGSTNGGFVVGSNGYGDMVKGQEFHLSGPAQVDELLFLFVKEITTGGANSTIMAKIWDMDGTGTTSVGEDMPAPGTVLAQSMAISIDDIDTTGLMGIMLGPVWVNGIFTAGIDVSNLSADDHVGIAHTADGSFVVDDRSWEQWSDNDWYSIANAWGLSIDIAVIPVFSPSIVGVTDGTWVNDMRMSFIGGNPARDNVTVRFENQQDAVMGLHIIDAAGRTVLNQDLGNRAAGMHNYDLNTNSWTAGIYYVTLRANGHPMTLKLVKE